MVMVPPMFTGRHLAELWKVDDPKAALWVDATLGGLPGYRPLVRPPKQLDRWMVDEVMAASSPLLDAAEAALAVLPEAAARSTYRSILTAIAGGDRTLSGIARVIGMQPTAMTRPLQSLQRAGLVIRIPDPLRDRRDLFDLADPHLRFWLKVIASRRTQLSAGRAAEVWAAIRETTWLSQVLGPRWESVVRSHLAASWPMTSGAVVVGTTTISDRSAKKGHELDIVVTVDGKVAALGEAKLRRLGRLDVDRLRRLQELIGAPEARLVLASATGVDQAAVSGNVSTIGPSDIYG